MMERSTWRNFPRAKDITVKCQRASCWNLTTAGRQHSVSGRMVTVEDAAFFNKGSMILLNYTCWLLGCKVWGLHFSPRPLVYWALLACDLYISTRDQTLGILWSHGSLNTDHQEAPVRGLYAVIKIGCRSSFSREIKHFFRNFLLGGHLHRCLRYCGVEWLYYFLIK